MKTLKIPKRLFGSVGSLSVGSVLGYTVILLLTPVLTRLYTPSEFGVYAVFSAFVAIAAQFIALGYPFGQLTARSATGALRFGVVSLVVSSALLMILAALVILTQAVGFLASIWVLPSLVALACSFLAVLTGVNINLAVREDKAGRAALSIFVNLGGRSVFQTVGGVIGCGVAGLILSEVFARVVAWLSSECGVLRLALRVCRTRLKSVIKTATSEWTYPLLVTPSLMIEVLLVWLPAPVFTIVYSAEIGGYIALVQRFSSAPVTIANQSLAVVFHQSLVRDPLVVRSFLSKYLLAFVIGFISFAVVASTSIWHYGPSVAAIIFGGEGWADVSVVVVGFTWIFIGQFVCLFTDRILLVERANEVKFFWLLVGLIISISTIIAGATFGVGWRETVLIFSATQALVYAALFFSSLRVYFRQKAV